jgi:hypothetical protein
MKMKLLMLTTFMLIIVLTMSVAPAFAKPLRVVATLTSPNPVGASGDMMDPYPGGLFGYTVATGGNYIFVSAPREGGLVYVYNAATKAYVTTMGSTGSTVATGGGYVAIGNPGEGVGGEVYVYSLSNLNTIVATIADPNNLGEYMIYQGFGNSIAISDNRMLISDFGSSSSDTGIEGNPGAGWTGDIYVYSVPEFQYLATLPDPNPTYSVHYEHNFGLTFSGNYIVVGAPAATISGALGSGSVYVYDSAFNLVSTIGNPSTEGFMFGWSVAAGSGYFVVGAHGNAVTSGTETLYAAGSAYIYSLNAETGETTLTATLNSKNPAEGGGFGYSVSTDGTNVIVGAPGEDVNIRLKGKQTTLNPAGNAYIFTASGSYSKTLSSPDPEGYTTNTQFGDDYGGYFGYTVAAGSGFYVVGAPCENVIIGTPKSSTTYVDAGHAYIIS